MVVWLPPKYFSSLTARSCQPVQLLGPKLIYELQAHDSSCQGFGVNRRIPLGDKFESVAACAEAVSVNCKCGRGFEFDKTNNGFCGCGAAGTTNSDCDEFPDDFCFETNRYLLFNPACKQAQLDDADSAASAEQIEMFDEVRSPATVDQALPKRTRRVCFDVYDEPGDLHETKAEL